MKKFYSLLGAFAVAALGAFSASAAALPTDLLTVTPEQGTPYDINEFPTSFIIAPTSSRFKGLDWSDDTNSYSVPNGVKITITFPDNATKDYSFAAKVYQTSLPFTVPAADVKAHGAGTISFTAYLNGISLQTGDALADYSWTYTLTGEVASNVIPDYGMPEGITFDSAYGLDPTAGPVKEITQFNLIGSGNMVFTRTGAVALYKEVNGEFTEQVATGNYTYDGIRDITVGFSRPYISEPGKYRVVVTFANSGMSNSGSTIKNISFDCEIAAKPNPVNVTYEFVPATGSPINVADFPAQVGIQFTNAASLSGTAYSDLLTMTAPDGSIVEISRSGSVSGNTVSYTVPVPTQNGEYKFTFNASAFKGTAENEADLIFPTAPIAWSYTITGNKVAVPDNIKITPEQGKAAQADFASGITIECKDASYTVRGDGASLTINGVKYDKNNTTVTANQQGNKIIFAVPATVFANGGTFDCEADLTGVEFRNGTFQVITLAATTFNWTWTLPEPAKLPTLQIDGTANEEAAVEVAKGAKISFGTVPEGTKIYYKWTAAAAENTVLIKAPAAGYTEYAKPIVINEAGALSYYAENSVGKSDVKTINFTVKSGSALPAGIESITPAPGSTVDDTLTEIVFTFNAKQDYAQMLSNVTAATLTINGGTPLSGVGTANANQSMDGKIKFVLTSDVKWKDGENTVVFTRNDAKCAMGDNYLPETYSLTYLYEAPGQVLPPTNITVDPNPEQTQARAWLGTIKITFKDASELGMAAQMIAKPETATLTVNGVTFPANVGATGGFASEATLIFTVPETVTWNNGLNTVVFAKGEANAPYNTGADYIPATFSFEYNVDDSVAVEGIEIETAADYYTVEGIKVQNPEAGKLYIKVANGKASKVIIR